jgi:putrescine transport system substrate-binding protein
MGRTVCRSLLILLLAGSCTLAASNTDNRLFIFNWTDFIGQNTIKEFEKETGIKVVYDVYDSEETMDARLLAGESGYDVVIASMEYFGPEIRAGVYIPLDRARLPNWKNLDPRVLAIQTAHDPGNVHSIPYLHSINGFSYNVDMIHARMPNAPVDSLDMLFKPEVVSKFSDCGVTFLDSAADTLMLALQYLGLDPNTKRREDYKAAAELLLKVRPYVRTFDSSEYLNGLANREICLAMSWSSDYALSRSRASAVGVNLNLAFTVPKEGANQNFASMLIPVGAPHVDAAYKFLNFILRPSVIAEITNELYYGNDNIASRSLINPTILNDVTLYPTPELEARLFRSDEVSPETERIRTRTWTRVKTTK